MRSTCAQLYPLHWHQPPILLLWMNRSFRAIEYGDMNTVIWILYHRIGTSHLSVHFQHIVLLYSVSTIIIYLHILLYCSIWDSGGACRSVDHYVHCTCYRFMSVACVGWPVRWWCHDTGHRQGGVCVCALFNLWMHAPHLTLLCECLFIHCQCLLRFSCGLVRHPARWRRS